MSILVLTVIYSYFLVLTRIEKLSIDIIFLWQQFYESLKNSQYHEEKHNPNFADQVEKIRRLAQNFQHITVLHAHHLTRMTHLSTISCEYPIPFRIFIESRNSCLLLFIFEFFIFKNAKPILCMILYFPFDSKQVRGGEKDLYRLN